VENRMAVALYAEADYDPTSPPYEPAYEPITSPPYELASPAYDPTSPPYVPAAALLAERKRAREELIDSMTRDLTVEEVEALLARKRRAVGADARG